MPGSAECKALLEQDPRLAQFGGGWKRVSKSTADDGVERVFRNKAGTCFVRVVKNFHGLTVTGFGPTLADAMQPSATDPTGAALVPRPTLDPDPRHHTWAKRFFGRDGEEESDPAELTPAQVAQYGRALANQVGFGVYGLDDLMDSGAVVVAFAPLERWNREGCIPDFDLPLQPLMPYPQVSESPNESGDWCLGGFDGDIRACIRALIERGFHWREDIQAIMNNPDTAWVTGWMNEGAPGAQTAQATLEAARAAVGPQAFPHVATEEDMGLVLRDPNPLVLMFPYGPEPVTDAFWGQLAQLQRALGQPRIYQVGEGTPIAQAMDHQSGPAQGWRWTWFVQGQRMPPDLEGMSMHLFDGLVRECLKPAAPKAPRP